MKSAGLIAVVIITLIVGCNTPEKLLCRQWRVEDVEFDEKAYSLTKEQKPEMVQQLRDSCLFVFNRDHTYSLKLPQKIETGIWRFSRNHDTIFTQNNQYSIVNVLNKTTLDANAYGSDGISTRFILAPVQKK